MPRRPTSVAAYRSVVQNGVLSASRERVYTCLFNHGPMTAGELTKRLLKPTDVNPSYHRRLHELEQLGMAARRPGHERTCSITGHTAEEWDVTDAGAPTGVLLKSLKKHDAPQLTNEEADALYEWIMAYADPGDTSTGTTPTCRAIHKLEALTTK